MRFSRNTCDIGKCSSEFHSRKKLPQIWVVARAWADIGTMPCLIQPDSLVGG